MLRKTLLFGLVLLPFYEFIIYILMPAGRIPEWIDFRVTKEYIAIGLALIVTALVWKEVKKIECPNMWTLWFLVFMFFNLSKSPIAVANPIVDLSLLGRFSAEFKVFTFFLMFCTVSSIKFSDRFIEKIFFTLFVGAIVMSFYMILQALNLDQILKPKDAYLLGEVKGVRVAGFFGQPTLAVPYLLMGIPFAVYFKKIWGVIVIGIAALLTGSDFAIVGLALIFGIYSIGKKRMMVVSGIAFVGCLILYALKPDKLFFDNGRFLAWGMILEDVFSGKINGVDVRIGLFGAGLNNFGEMFTALHTSAYTRAHNEFLQVLWCCGVVGEAIFVMINFEVFKTAWSVVRDNRAKTLAISLVAIVFCSMGTFVFQLGAYQFFTVLIVALIYQLKNQNTGDMSCLNY